MQVSVEKISNVESRLTITVPAEQVEKEYSKKIQDVAKTANIKGFRPGKAPLSFIQQRFGESTYKEALSKVIQETLFEAINENKLKPIAMPRVEPKAALPNQPLEYTAIVETLPEIGSIAFKTENIEKITTAITAADVDFVIEQLQKQRAQWEEVSRPAETKDRVAIAYQAIVDGKEEPQGKVENYTLELGSHTMLPGFEEGLIGATVGDEKTLALTFPDNYHDKEKANKPVTFIVKIKQIFAPVLPVVDQAFIKGIGVNSGSHEDLRKQITHTLEQERDRLIKEKLKTQVFEVLLAQNPLEVPPSLVAKEAKNIHDEIYSKQHQHDHASHSADELAVFNDIAKKRVALGLLIAEYAKQHHIQVDKTRVDARIEEIAAVYENPAEVMTWLSTHERRANIESQVLEDQMLETIIADVPATEKVLSYAELRGSNQHATLAA